MSVSVLTTEEKQVSRHTLHKTTTVNGILGGEDPKSGQSAHTKGPPYTVQNSVILSTKSKLCDP